LGDEASQFDLSQRFLVGGGDMGSRVRGFDWASTPLGALTDWPQSLRSAVSILLPSRAQICLFWGPRLITLYNDAYRAVLAGKHPQALGLPARECWHEIWDVLGPLLAGVVTTGEAFWARDYLYYLHRSGYSEETYFDMSYDPVRDESGKVGGVFCIVSETTGRVLGERRLRTLRDLGAHTAEAHTPEEVCRSAAGVLAANPRDVPFALLYLRDRHDPDAFLLRLAAAAGPPAVGGEAPGANAALQGGNDSPWPFDAVLRDGKTVLVERLPAGLAGARQDGAGGGQAGGGQAGSGAGQAGGAAQALVLPLGSGARGFGVLVAGVSPFLALTGDYRDFFDLVAARISAAIGGAVAYEEERRRAEILAELDRVKTDFFSNVSHEFRTPLTLLLGPLEELAHTAGLPEAARRSLDFAYRNGLRLLRLVNTLLDFSRLEASRAQASYEPLELAAETADLASLFRSAVEQAGLRLVVEAPPLPEPIYVDREMWEKIVLNLLSNALKFTFAGEIRIAVQLAGPNVELVVADTGCGIPAGELPHLFERFHRVRGARARTHEGTGIGLALVHELVKLHGGDIRVASVVDRGTTFTVSLPRGSAHLPEERVATVASAASDARVHRAYLEEARLWVGSGGPRPGLPSGAQAEASGGSQPAATVLLVDDNADMRTYVRGLLEKASWRVREAADGAAALALARAEPPDLVLADVMMPVVGGFELLRELRRDPATQGIPVILLSARAGEESRVEGLQEGADDYLIKPFSARELQARVAAHLKLARSRQEALRREQLARGEAQAANLAKDEFLSILSHELRNPLAPIRYAAEIVRRGGGDQRTQKAIDVIDRQVHHLSRLLDDLLDVARITRGKINLQRTAVDLREAIAEAVETAKPLLDTRRHSLTVSIPGAPLLVQADRTRLQQIVGNLVNNAARYTPPGGRIVVSAERQDDEVVLRVTDNGEGIPPAMLSRIFDLFTQVAGPAAAGASGGLGVGLALVRKLVELHGGSVRAASAGPGSGSEFEVRLRALAAWEEAPGTAAAGAGVAAGRRIVVIEDNEDSRVMLKAALEGSGHRVWGADAGQPGIDLVGAERPDLAIVDLHLPDLDGHEVARRIRALHPGVHLIALTGYGQPQDLERSRAAGFDAHLVKPVNLAALEKAIGETAVRETSVGAGE
jgi:signal transduction histidine kinase